MKKTESGEIIRFGVSIDEVLLSKFDELITSRGYTNRSEAIRDLVRAELVKESWAKGKTSQVALLGLVYRHEHGDLMHRLMHLQHEHAQLIISNLHVHLDPDNCLEVLVLKGPTETIEHLAEQLLSTKGVKFGQLMRATTGKEI